MKKKQLNEIEQEYQDYKDTVANVLLSHYEEMSDEFVEDCINLLGVELYEY